MKKLFFILLSAFCFSALTIEAKPTEKQSVFTELNDQAMPFVYVEETEFIALMSERDLNDLTDNLEGTERTELLELVNKEAVGEINSYLQDRYTLPVTGTDDKLTTLTKDLMKYRLYKRRDELNLPDNVLRGYQMIVKDLERIANGTINLSIDKAGGGDNTAIQNVQTENRPVTPRYNLG